VLDTTNIFTSVDMGRGIVQHYTYNNTSTSTAGNIMKYRLEHVLKADVDFTFFDFVSLGVSTQYYSSMKNIDRCFYEFDRFSSIAPYIIQIEKNGFPFDYIEKYMKEHAKGMWVFGLRSSVEMWNVKLSVIVSNVFNQEYSLRPMAAEASRITTLQLIYKFTEGEPMFPKRKKNT
jgi:outer membrane receptor for Fe3+-dicitrate